MNAAASDTAWRGPQEQELLVSHPVYVVEDHRQMREFIELVLEENGLACRAFESGEDFIEALDGLAPGCVLLDMRLPRRNGLQIQADIAHSGRDLPVVVMTGYGRVEMAVESMKLGAVEFLQKPFTEEALLDALREAFARLDTTERRALPSL